MRTVMMLFENKNTVRLERGDWRAVVDPAHGANCISLRNLKYGARVLREPTDTDLLDGSYLYGMPILFPANRMENGRFTFEGRQYVFPINEQSTGCHLHGELNKTEFNVTRTSDCKVECRYTATKQNPYLSFPHEFEILSEHELKADGLYHTVTVTNLSDIRMPIFLGFHTTFNTLFLRDSRPENIRVLAEISEEYARNTDNHLPNGEKPKFDAVSRALSIGAYKPFSEKESRHYRGAGRMAVTDIGARLRVVYENDEKYGFRLIYNSADGGYVCLEPQTCLVNCQNSPFSRDEAGFDFIEAKGSKSYSSKIFLEEI